ncbi:MAG: hypothetical protein ABR498_09875 [Candidatus Dormibacteria bacterium]
MTALQVLIRPRRALEDTVADARPRVGAAYVLVSGMVTAGLGLATSALEGSGVSGVFVSLIVVPLFVVYWLAQAWLVDAGAGMIGRAGRRSAFLGVSGYLFLAWIAYGLLVLAEAGARHLGGAGPSVASGLSWLTVPVLLWFLGLTVLSVRAVYEAPWLNAFALALLPYAAVTAALTVLTAALSVIRSG